MAFTLQHPIEEPRQAARFRTVRANDGRTPQPLVRQGGAVYRDLRQPHSPKTAVWKDELDRPHQIYHGEPIKGLSHLYV